MDNIKGVQSNNSARPVSSTGTVASSVGKNPVQAQGQAVVGQQNPGMGSGGAATMPEKGGSKWWIWLLLALGVIIVLALILLL